MYIYMYREREQLFHLLNKFLLRFAHVLKEVDEQVF